MYLLLWLAQEYIFQLTSLYVILQTLVLIVSLRVEREDEKGKEEAIESEQKEEDVEEEIQYGEDRWAGGSEDEGNSQDQWESEGEEEVGHAWVDWKAANFVCYIGHHNALSTLKIEGNIVKKYKLTYYNVISLAEPK